MQKEKIKHYANNADSKKILIAMSGGVDSSVSAAQLKKQGFRVIGVFLKMFKDHYKQARKVEKICQHLKIPFYVFDVSKEFKREVIDYFISEYEQGRTPNPCVVCNYKIKFNWLTKIAKKLDCDYISTGHYAHLRREKTNNKSQISNSKSQTFLYKAKDKKKDQSYFLWQLSQKQLSKIIFPLGNYKKEEVKKLAEKYQLPINVDKESQDICFVESNTAEFLSKWSKKLIKSGNIVDTKKNVIGKHKGLCHYTIGQRKGLSNLNLMNIDLKKFLW